MSRIEHEFLFHRSIREAFEHWTDPNAIIGSLPPGWEWDSSQSGPLTALQRGQRVKGRLRWHYLGFPVDLRIVDYDPPQRVIIEQELGLLSEWRIEWSARAADHGNTMCRIELEYRLPLGLVGCLVDDLWWRRRCESLCLAWIERMSDAKA